jgi:hypothetical protein
MISDFQNNGAVVLTTPEPGAFINFRWEPGDPSIYLQSQSTPDVSAGMLWVNGLDISQEASIYGDPSINTGLWIGDSGDPSTASFFLYTRELGPFDANLSITTSSSYGSQILTGWITPTSPNVLTFVTSGRNIIDCSINSLGANIISNTESVNPGGVNIDISINYTILTGTARTLQVFEDYNSFSTAAASYSLSPGQNNFIHTTNSSTTSLFIRLNYAFSFGRFSADVDIFELLGGDTYDVSILNRPYIVSSDSVNTFETSNVQAEGDTSYLILRTNPKFSGNIKLTIDPSNLMYLDTFKVSDVLSNKLYRHQKISSNSVFSGDIRRVFSSMPLGEMYRLDAENTLDIAIPKTDLWEQYNLNYSYGARLFLDELYPEDYSMLAPLWINNTLPDYFAIFRIPGVFNEESYPEGEDEIDYSDLAQKFLEEGQLMESWGIKEGSPLGNYLRNHLSELSQVISPMFLSLSDPGLKDPDPNTWYGIAIDKGIITGRSETTYFFDEKSSNFTDLNAFCSEGFERLNLLCPNLINMEFAFNDNDVPLYTMQRYFGLYLTENPLYEISYYSSDPDSSIRIISLDGKDSNEFFSSPIFDLNGSISSDYSNRLFTLDDVLSIKRITNVNQVNGFEKDFVEEWVNKPGELLFSTEVKKIKNQLPFISIGINKLLSQGEHLRIIDKTSFKIWEVFAIDIDLLGPGESWTYASTYSDPSGNYPTVYRTMFSVKGTIEDQNNAIWNAWKVFDGYKDTPFGTLSKKKEGHSLEVKDWAYGNDLVFQRLTAQTTYYIFDPSSGSYDPNSQFNSAAGYGDLSFFGTLEPSEEDFQRVKYDSSYGPINFELFGDRMSIIVDIFDPASYSLYSLDSSVSDTFEDNMLYLSPDGWYRLVQDVDVSTSVNHSLQYIDDPTSQGDEIAIITEYDIITINEKWNSYAVYPLIISLMGINPVKDFDFTVYDSSTLDFKSSYWYNRDGDASTFSLTINSGNNDMLKCQNAYDVVSGTGSITIDGSSRNYTSGFKFNTFDGSAYISATTKTVISYAVLDGSASFKSYKEGYSEESIDNYYQDSSTLLKYGLTVPYVAKWVGIGNDCRNNQFRLMLDGSILDVSTNFIPYNGSFEGELFYPSFKYLSPGTRNWEDYVFFDINDSIRYIDDGSTYYTSFKELMFTDPHVDVFSKLVYSNNNVDGAKLRSSIVYYNNYKNTIDTVVNGISLSFTIVESARNIIDIQDWDRYRISVISVPSRNRDNNSPIEIFINENMETILAVWYQGNDILNYTYRNSTTLPGKGVLDPSELTIDPIQFRGFENTNKHYSHVKTPFGVNNASLSSNIFNIYGIDAAYDGSLASPFLQNNLNFGDNLFSVFNAYSGNSIVGTEFEFDNRQYNTFRQYIDYVYSKSDSTFGSNVANQAYSYMSNDNLYLGTTHTGATCDLATFQNILALNKIEYYIFRGETLYTSNSFTTNPVRILINQPRDYSGIITYNGWYKPQFNSILEFSYNEEKEIIDIVGKDFILGNTNIKSYNNIPQLWYNKVVDEVTSYDVSSGNAIDYVDSWNPFASQWDSAYYYLYDQGVKSSVDGYNSTLELPSYFGSKLVSLPEELILGLWSTTTTSEDFGPDRMSLSYNLTRSIVNIFKDNDVFINNWADLTQADNILDGYIKTTVLSYYNISRSKIKVDIWRKAYKGESTRIAYSLDSTFQKWDGANVNGSLKYVNNEYIYTVDFPLNPMYIYFVQFTLFEK